MHGYLTDNNHILANALEITASVCTQSVYLGQNDNVLELLGFTASFFSLPQEASLQIEAEISADNENFHSPVAGAHFCLFSKKAQEPACTAESGQKLFAFGLSKGFMSGWLRLKCSGENLPSGLLFDAFLHVAR